MDRPGAAALVFDRDIRYSRHPRISHTTWGGVFCRGRDGRLQSTCAITCRTSSTFSCISGAPISCTKTRMNWSCTPTKVSYTVTADWKQATTCLSQRRRLHFVHMSGIQAKVNLGRTQLDSLQLCLCCPRHGLSHEMRHSTTMSDAGCHPPSQPKYEDSHPPSTLSTISLQPSRTSHPSTIPQP